MTRTSTPGLAPAAMPTGGAPAAIPADVAALVSSYMDHSLAPGLGRIGDITDPAPAPGGNLIAFTGSVRESLPLPARDAVFVVRIDSGELTEVGGTGGATWSSDGSLLGYLDGPATITVMPTAGGPARTVGVPGVAEYLRFAPGSTRMLVGVADLDADRSGADGSGGMAEEDSAAIASVQTAGASGGWRRIWQIDASEGTAAPTQLSPIDCNVWEADWCATGVIAIASEQPEEGGWFESSIVSFSGPDSSARVLATSDDQLGLLCAAPDGHAIAYVDAICSDRGVIAGTAKILDLDTGTCTAVDSGDVDITSLVWRDDTSLLAAGQRHLETVVAVIGRDGSWRELWCCTDRTCGQWYPSAVPVESEVGDAFVAVVHGYGQPPALTVVTPTGETSVVGTAHEGTRYVRDAGGTLTAHIWRAPDGLDIEGLLATPAHHGPHPLIVLVHGGPVAAYRPSWQMIYGWTPLLVAAGYAVLHPNPRGSGGRGRQFAALVRGDMGGDDTRDFTSAVEALVDRGLVDPARIAVTGRSYGGYMSSWLVTQDGRFAAAAPMAPVSNWFSQHFTSNLGRFDEDFLADRVTNPSGRFFSRSPVFFADRVRTPVLTITGGRDRCTPPSQAVEFHHALTRHGKDSTLVVYPTEGHHIDSPAAIADLLGRLLTFFGFHLGAHQPDVTGRV